MKNFRYAITLLLACFTSNFAIGQTISLRYKAPQTPVTYEVKMTTDSPADKSTYQGRITYEGRSEGSVLSLSFKGGLKESTQKKQTLRPSRGFGDPFGGASGAPPGFASPFARPQGPGALRQTTAKIRITSTGEILSLEGDSQTPLPLGHLSLLVLEPLPSEAKSSWSTSNGVTLGKPARPSGGSPFDPFARRAEPSKSSSGSEGGLYTVKGSSGNRISINKQYTLDSPNSKPPFKMTGGGLLDFDPKLGLFLSGNLKYELKVAAENVEIRIPVTVDFRLMTAHEISTADQKKREAAAEAANKATAAARAKFAHLSESQVADLYQTGGLVPPTGRVVASETRLPKGLIIQIKWPGYEKWSPAKVVKELSNGQVEYEKVSTKKLYKRDRSVIFLAPNFVDQPFVSKDELAAFQRQHGDSMSEAPSVQEYRTWQTASGKFSVEAKLVEVDGDNVVLNRKKDGREIKVPIKALSTDDQSFISQQKSSEANPFE